MSQPAVVESPVQRVEVNEMGSNHEQLYGGKPKPEQAPPKQFNPKKLGSAALKGAGVKKP